MSPPTFSEKVASLTTSTDFWYRNCAKVCFVIVLPLFYDIDLFEVSGLPINLKDHSVGPEYSGAGP